MRSWIPSRSTLTTIGFLGVNSGVGVGLGFCVGEGDFFSSPFFSSPLFSFAGRAFVSPCPLPCCVEQAAAPYLLPELRGRRVAYRGKHSRIRPRQRSA